MLHIQKQVYCKESTHVFMEAGKSQDIQGELASWRSREPKCVLLVWMLEKGMATHSSVLAWRIPGTVEHGGLPSMGSHRARHD